MTDTASKHTQADLLNQYQADATRHFTIFAADRFADTRVDVIGVGATGSQIVFSLAKLGVRNIHVWDYDTIESHNIANQMYGPGHVGMKKVDALKEIIHSLTGITISTHDHKVVDGDEIPGEVVFLLVDSVDARKSIYSGCLEMNITTKRVIETRMGSQQGEIYVFDPQVMSEGEKWLATLPASDDESDVERSPCGTPITVGQTATLIAGYAVWQFIRCVNKMWYPEDEKHPDLEMKLSFYVNPYIMYYNS